MRCPVATNDTDYEYRTSTISHHPLTLPQPVAVVTVGVPKDRIKIAKDGSVTPLNFLISLSSIDMRQLRDHLKLKEGGVIDDAWLPAPRPSGKETFKGVEGTLFWVENPPGASQEDP